jgi:hypothetical protein
LDNRSFSPNDDNSSCSWDKQVDYVTTVFQADIDTNVDVEMPRGLLNPVKFSSKGIPSTASNEVPETISPICLPSSKLWASNPVCQILSSSSLTSAFASFVMTTPFHLLGLNLIWGLKNLVMDLEEEDDVTGFLGVLVRKIPGATMTFELLQTGLVQRIIDALQITNLPTRKTPSKLGVLSTDQEGDPPITPLAALLFSEQWYTCKLTLVRISDLLSPSTLDSQLHLEVMKKPFSGSVHTWN